MNNIHHIVYNISYIMSIVLIDRYMLQYLKYMRVLFKNTYALIEKLERDKRNKKEGTEREYIGRSFN